MPNSASIGLAEAGGLDGKLQVLMFIVLFIVFVLPDACSLDLRKERFAEPAKLLPIVFVSFVIAGLWSIYTFYHCYEAAEIPISHFRIWVFNLSTSLLVICYFKCIFIHPGTIPDKEEDPSWIVHSQDAATTGAADREAQGAGVGAVLHETKRTGDRRSCKWCSKYKPDRCHHCRVCRMCILKMDHHCPWIYNCVGHNNHKYFFLLLLYSMIDCHIIAWTMYRSLGRVIVSPNTPFLRMFFLLFGQTLTVFIGFLVTAFFGFHIWLMLKAMTTIEFCEKSMKRMGFDASTYDRGLRGNVRAVLGNYTILWCLPIAPPSGPGLNFVSEETRLLPRTLGDAESGEATNLPVLPVSALPPLPPSAPHVDSRPGAGKKRHRAGTGAAPSSNSATASEDEGRVKQSDRMP
jgi:hypothetical protein